MPILDLQQRITERGRIRLGTKVDGTRRDGSTYTRPAKSRTFLISSHDRTVVETAREEWADTAGQVEEFDAGFRIDTGRTELDVILPPEMMSFSQWREMWGKGYCQRRCDGQRETISDGPCLCPDDHEERRVLAAKGQACKDTTRLSVMLPDLPGFGLWRVESHGFYAATELAGAVQAVTHLAPNTLVRARLTAVAREVVRFDSDGKPKTHKFVVPTLDLPDVRLRELIGSDGGVGVAINAPSRPAGLTPVAPAALTETTGQSIAEQLQQTKDTPRRKNAAAILPPTGLRPGQIEAGAGNAAEPPPAGVPSRTSDAPPAVAPGPARPEPERVTPEVVAPESSGGERQAPPPVQPPPDVSVESAPGGEVPEHGSEATASAVDPPSGPVTLGDLLNRMEGKAAATRKGRLLKVATEVAREHTWPVPETIDDIDQRLLDAIADGLPIDDPRANQRRWMHAVWGLNGGNEKRKDAISRLTSGATDSSGDLTDEQWREFMDVTGALPVQLPPREQEVA